jgi:hypothetical protein
MKSIFAALILSTHFAIADVAIPDYEWSVTDFAERNLSKEKVFSEMDRKFIKVGNSICANRALMWSHDFKTKYGVDGAKVFLFYTPKTGGAGDKRWWYHVAPVIAENKELFVMDAGFSFIKGPLLLNKWLDTFSKGANCKEISAQDSDLIQMMNEGQQFPTETRYGSFDCYYKVVPAGLWFPATVAASLSGANIPNEIQRDEVYSACLEAVTSPLGRVFGTGKKACRKYLGQ